MRSNDDERAIWVITGVNRLNGYREEVSGAMPKQQAKERLEREQKSYARLRYKPYKSMRVEKLAPVQLTLKFEEYE